MKNPLKSLVSRRSMGSRAWVAGVAVAMSTLVLAGAPAAEAATPKPATLCTTFVLCEATGRTSGGYSLVFLTSFWSMTPGHNCTNYVSYRLSHGRTVARPPGTGNAASWGPAARKASVPVTNVPKVGAVAWWDSGKSGTGSSGHVAYVQKVESSGAVLISEDNLRGEFKWRRIVPKTTGWPSGFIHYPASNGSPLGTLTSASSPAAKQLDLWGSSSDPDAGKTVPSYLVTIGGPRGTAGVESFTFTTEYYTFHRLKTVRATGTKNVYLYALNTPGTKGTDVLLGQRSVTFR